MARKFSILAVALFGLMSVHVVAQLLDARWGSGVMLLAFAAAAIGLPALFVTREVRFFSAVLAVACAVCLQWALFAYSAYVWGDSGNRQYYFNAQIGLMSPATFVLASASAVVCALIRRSRPNA